MDSEQSTIYLDHHATTPMDEEVMAAMMPYFTTHFGNPSGTDTASGRRAAEAVKESRRKVAELLGAESSEIVFTSGATEANNLAILGTVRGLRARTNRNVIVTSSIEHKAVLEACRAVEREGFVVRLLPVTSTGRVDTAVAKEMIGHDTLLVSIQAANNEIGTLQPIGALAEIAHAAGALFHSDAAQAVGKVPIDVLELGVDLLSLSAHKFYGPKGVGGLYVRNGPNHFPIQPIVHGGGQEQGLRSGTINVPAVVGFGCAAEIARQRLADDSVRLSTMRDRFEDSLLHSWPGVRRNGDLMQRLPINSSITFVGCDAQAVIAQARNLELSTGSACTSGALEPSHVLQAIGLSRELAYSTVRVGFGRTNTEDEAHLAAIELANAANAVRRTS